jgi:hypothetical protein
MDHRPCEGSGGALKSPIGWLPSPHDLDLAELDIDHMPLTNFFASITRNGKKRSPRTRVFRFVRRRGAGRIAKTARATRRSGFEL